LSARKTPLTRPSPPRSGGEGSLGERGENHRVAPSSPAVSELAQPSPSLHWFCARPPPLSSRSSAAASRSRPRTAKTLLARSPAARAQSQELPKDLAAWLHIDKDGKITVFTGKVEVGQNIRTSLAQQVAEELRVGVDAITMVMGDTDLVPWDAGHVRQPHHSDDGAAAARRRGDRARGR
jgi:hypothetical protein